MCRETRRPGRRPRQQGCPANLIPFSHTHEPLDRSVQSKRLINPGSVGYPQGEEGTARHAVLTWDGEWHVEFHLAHYEVEKWNLPQASKLREVCYTTLYSTISRPSRKRARSSCEMSSVWALPSRTSSASSRPQAGPCWKPWPLKPPMQ